MKVIVKRPGESSHVEDVVNELEVWQDIVKGRIEVLRLTSDFAILVNEEGRLDGSRYNCRFLNAELYGTVIGIGIDGEDFTDCPIDLETWRGCIKV